MSLDPQQTAQLRAPVGPKASFDAVKVRGVHGYDETSGCPTICPGDGLDYKRSLVHPSDVPAASALSGSETITALQGSGLVRTTLQAIADLVASGLYQPLDEDLTAIAALSTQAFGRSLLTAADRDEADALLGKSKVWGIATIGDGAEQTYQEFVTPADGDFELFFYTNGAATLRIYDENSLVFSRAFGSFHHVRLASLGAGNEGSFVMVDGAAPEYVGRADAGYMVGSWKITAQGAPGSYIIFRKLNVW